MNTPSIGELVRTAEKNYISGPTNISEYVDFDLRENINRIEAYYYSKHISGETDSLNREKPFFNISTAAVNIWYRATDIDRKNIRIKPTKISQTLSTFIGTILLQEWMRKSGFGKFLNEWGRALAIYGSAICKFVEKNNDLVAHIVPWNRIICDPIDFENNLKIEKLEYTPAQLREIEGYDQDKVEELIEALDSREDLTKRKRDTKNQYITLYEVHGKLPLSLITGNERDNKVYAQQMHVISFVGVKKGRDIEYMDYTLVKGREKKDPYMITHLIKEPNRVQAIGAIEHLFQSQWMMNHTAKSIKDQLDLASKLIFQTADQNYVGRNALDSINVGDILVHEFNKPLTQLNNGSHDITSLISFGQQWQALAKEITSTPDSISGNTMPSGTAYRQVAILNNESHSLFELMTENKGLEVEDMLKTHVIPHLKKKMDTADEIAVTLDEHGIKRIDSLYIPNEAIRRRNRKIIDTVLSNNEVTNENVPDIANFEMDIRKELGQLGTQRFLKPSDIDTIKWREALDDFEGDIEYEITGESSEMQAGLETLSTVFQTIANPVTAQVLETPRGKFLFNKILEKTGEISSIELSQVESEAKMQPTQPNLAPQGVTPQPNINSLMQTA